MPDQYPSPTDPATGLPQSPTGTPLLPPTIARWATLGVVVLLAGLTAAAVSYPEAKWLQIALSVVTAIGAVLGIASPGLRRTVGILLLVAVTVTASSCAWLQQRPKLVADLGACATGAISSEVEALMGEAATALQSSPVDWDAHLDKLVAKGGQAALCAIMALADALVSGSGGSQTDPLGDYDRAMRAAYLRTFAKAAEARAK